MINIGDTLVVVFIVTVAWLQVGYYRYGWSIERVVMHLTGAMAIGALLLILANVALAVAT